VSPIYLMWKKSQRFFHIKGNKITSSKSLKKSRESVTVRFQKCEDRPKHQTFPVQCINNNSNSFVSPKKTFGITIKYSVPSLLNICIMYDPISFHLIRLSISSHIFDHGLMLFPSNHHPISFHIFDHGLMLFPIKSSPPYLSTFSIMTPAIPINSSPPYLSTFKSYLLF